MDFHAQNESSGARLGPDVVFFLPEVRTIVVFVFCNFSYKKSSPAFCVFSYIAFLYFSGCNVLQPTGGLRNARDPASPWNFLLFFQCQGLDIS